MKHFFSKIITLIKGQDYKIDDNIPFGYLIRLFLTKGTYMLYGMIRLSEVSQVNKYQLACL